MTGKLAGQVGGVARLTFMTVFAVANTALVLRRDPGQEGGFKTPTIIPVIGAVACLYLLGPWARLEADLVQHKIAAGMLAPGVVLWVITWFLNRATGTADSRFEDVDHLGG